jgi:hypothetical protein
MRALPTAPSRSWLCGRSPPVERVVDLVNACCMPRAASGTPLPRSFVVTAPDHDSRRDVDHRRRDLPRDDAPSARARLLDHGGGSPPPATSTRTRSPATSGDRSTPAPTSAARSPSCGPSPGSPRDGRPPRTRRRDRGLIERALEDGRAPPPGAAPLRPPRRGWSAEPSARKAGARSFPPRCAGGRRAPGGPPGPASTNKPGTVAGALVAPRGETEGGPEGGGGRTLILMRRGSWRRTRRADRDPRRGQLRLAVEQRPSRRDPLDEAS